MSLRCEIFSGQVDQQLLSDLSVLSETAVGDGLVVPFSQEFLKEMLALKDSYLAVCFELNHPIGFAIYQTTLNDPPEWIRSLTNKLKDISKLGYANLIMIDKNHRGSDGGYDSILSAVLASAPAAGVTFFTLARLDNSRAMSAHNKRGWVKAGYVETIELGGKPCHFTLMTLGPKSKEIAAKLSGD